MLRTGVLEAFLFPAWFKRRSQLRGGWGRHPKGDAPSSEAGALGARSLLPARPQPPRRPQDVDGGFAPESDTWYLPRVCGTFKERAGWHGCQMPEQLLGRIIRGCSNPGATVLDPFGGSGTTLTVAKKLGRRFLGFELSPDYASAIEARLASAKVGGALEGGVEPLAGGKGRARSNNRPL